jgi:hypothetical protein
VVTLLASRSVTVVTFLSSESHSAQWSPCEMYIEKNVRDIMYFIKCDLTHSTSTLILGCDNIFASHEYSVTYFLSSLQRAEQEKSGKRDSCTGTSARILTDMLGLSAKTPWTGIVVINADISCGT